MVEYIKFPRTCPLCHGINYVTVKLVDLQAWNNGALAQRVFTYLTPEQREIIISGICPTCYHDFVDSMGDDDDE